MEWPNNVAIEGELGTAARKLFADWAAACHTKADCKVFVQLSHGGRQCTKMVNNNPAGPGDIRLNLPKVAFGTPRALTVAEVEEVRIRS